MSKTFRPFGDLHNLKTIRAELAEVAAAVKALEENPESRRMAEIEARIKMLGDDLAEENDRLRAEVERLTAELKFNQDAFDAAGVALKEYEAMYHQRTVECDELRGVVREARDTVQGLECKHGRYDCISAFKDNNLDRPMCDVCKAKEEAYTWLAANPEEK